jgi:hypothetical protein
MSLTKKDEIFRNKPYIKLYFQNEENPLNSDFRLESIQNKPEFYIRFKGKNLSSSVAPKKSAERLINSISNYENQVIFILGIGNPHLLKDINEKLKENQILIFIDLDPNILVPIWELFLEDILLIPGRHLFLGEEKLYLLWNYIESLPIEKMNGIKFLRNQPSLDLSPDFYLEIEARIRKIFSSKMSDLLTKFEFDSLWARNSYQNLLSYNDTSQIAKYKFNTLIDKFNSIPAILVSAGPSLRAICPLIKTHRDKFFIFACDTALKVLLKFGIIPDGVMTLDAQTHSYFHFLGEDLKEIPLFSDFVTSPNLLRNFQFRSIVFSMTAKFQFNAAGKSIKENTAGGKYINEVLGEIGDVQSGGSVATSAFDILRQMNFSTLFLVGQDLAYTGREIHSTGTHHNEKWLTIIHRKNSLEKINEVIVRKRETVFVKANNDKEVISDFILGIYKNWFEESAKQTAQKIYNINEKGARIENIQSINRKTAEEIFQTLEIHNYPWRELEPWKLNSFNFASYPDSIAIEFREKINSVEIKILKIQNDLDSFSVSEILESSDIIFEMIRKTKVYISRNSDLAESKKKSLLIESILNEIRILKRKI